MERCIADWEAALSHGVLGAEHARIADQGDFMPAAEELLFYVVSFVDDSMLGYECNGEVLLFGKLRQKVGYASGSTGHYHYVSCCIRIHEVPSILSFGKRDGSTKEQVEADAKGVLMRHDGGSGWDEHGDRVTWSWKRKRYCFAGNDVVKGESDWLEAVCPPQLPTPASTARGVHFSRICGSRLPAKLRVIISRGIRGPCWLRIADPAGAASTFSSMTEVAVKDVSQRRSTCSMEYHIPSQEWIHPLVAPLRIGAGPAAAIAFEEAMAAALQRHSLPTTPPLDMLIVSLQHRPVNAPEQRAAASAVAAAAPEPVGSFASEFTSAGCMVVRDVETDCTIDPIRPGRCSVVSLSGDTIGAAGADTEARLLRGLIGVVEGADADILVMYGAEDGLMTQLVGACARNSIDWWRFGRLVGPPPSTPVAVTSPHLKLHYPRYSTAGRLFLDPRQAALHRGRLRATSFALEHLAATVLPPLEPASAGSAAAPAPASAADGELARCFAVVRVVALLDVLQQSKRLTMLAGNRWQRSLQGGFANRVDWLLMHGFSERGYVLPDLFEDDETDLDDAASVQTGATEQAASGASAAPTPGRIPRSLTEIAGSAACGDLETIHSSTGASEGHAVASASRTASAPVPRSAALPSPRLPSTEMPLGPTHVAGTGSPTKMSGASHAQCSATAVTPALTKIDPVTGIRLPATPSRSPSSNSSRTHQHSVGSSRGRRSDEAGLGTSSHAMRFEGGLVLTPQTGLYDEYIVVLDFKSLYPSMISEFNICLSTVDWARHADSIGRGKKPNSELRTALRAAEKANFVARWDPLASRLDADAYTVVPPIPTISTSTAVSAAASSRGSGDIGDADEDGRGLLPLIMDSLMSRRADTKRRLAACEDPMTRARLDSEQLALKVLANSIFGALGSRWTRFTAIPISALITAQGRKVIMLAKQVAEEEVLIPEGKPLRVVYGDTDSILVATGTRSVVEATRIATSICAAVNSRFPRGTVCLELQSLFARALLVTKKCYVGLEASPAGGCGEASAAPASGSPWLPEPGVAYRLKHTGVFVVRRDWSRLAQQVGSALIDILIGPSGDAKLLSRTLAGAPAANAVSLRREACLGTLRELATRMRAGKWQWEELTIHRGLTRAPATYAQERFLQAAVASRMLRAGIPWTIGDAVPFVVVDRPPLDRDDGTVAPRPAEPPVCAEGLREWFATSQRARHVSETADELLGLRPDVEWYLSQQVLQPVTGLLEPLGISHEEIAAALGVTPTKSSASGALLGAPKRVECPECGKTFASNSTMRRHARKRHSPDGQALQLEAATTAGQPPPQAAATPAAHAPQAEPMASHAPQAHPERTVATPPTAAVATEAHQHVDELSVCAPVEPSVESGPAVSCRSCGSVRLVCADCGMPVMVLDGLRVVHAANAVAASKPSGTSKMVKSPAAEASSQTAASSKKTATPKPKSCPECGKAFYNHATMLRHFARFHGLPASADDDDSAASNE